MTELFEPREVWRTIPSLPNYIASSFGRVMRLPYRAPVPQGGFRPYGGTPTTGAWCEEDNRFVLQYAGKTYRVARLICEAFNGAPTDDKHICMHLDEDSRNNRPSNLAWGTQKQNLNAPGFIEYCKSRIGENSPTTKHRRKSEAA